MTRSAGLSLTPISLRLPTADLEYLRRVFPAGGYQTKIKELIHSYVEQLQAEGEATLADLERMYPNGK